MIRIEDRSSSGWKELIKSCLKQVLSVVPEKDVNGIDKIMILDECPDKEYSWAGGFYNAAHDNISASIELYPPKIIDAQPAFLPKIKFFKKYSIIKMFLHELGHHKCGIKDIEKREIEAEKYMLSYLLKLYGKWIYVFDFFASLDVIFRNKGDASE